MQNAYASPGGYLTWPASTSRRAAVIEKIALTVEAARRAGVQVVFFQNGWDPTTSRPAARARPTVEVQRAEDHARAAGAGGHAAWPRGPGTTPWSTGLPPQKGDIVIAKPRYSAFYNTALDSMLRARGIRNLAFCGIATNVCVESTLRDGYHREYFGVLLEDATHQAGPAFLQEATVFNVENFFGWVSTTADFCGWISQAPPE